jgi:hypothetical protein
VVASIGRDFVLSYRWWCDSGVKFGALNGDSEIHEAH